MDALRERPVLDVSGLPTVAFGRSNTTWLANVFYMMIEGTMFALLIASYFYLRTRTSNWPPANLPPTLSWGVINGIVFLVSLVPARYAQKVAPTGDRAKIRFALMGLAAFAVLNMVLRGFELANLNCRWYESAYGSAVWSIMGLHCGHLITEFVETVVILAVAFTDKMEGTRLVDVAINSDYWYFVVASALVSDFVVYGAARFL
ncbi:MAG: cytochrome C oxidase subunit III [Acidobacteria bacterium]|nr:cytochrome C oxidase subunit III [Acidobacteriota bacterium]MBV9481069.1 cytochrome C oxidase subunit III [Acidobacteriota bacterium]